MQNSTAATKPDYPEAVQALISGLIPHCIHGSHTAADNARETHRKTSDTLRGAEREIAGLQKKLTLDDGPHHEWAPLVEQCAELTDRE